MKPSYSQNYNDQSSLINQLKSRIFDLEQNEKSYQALSNSHVQLQTSYQQLNDENKEIVNSRISQDERVNHSEIIGNTKGITNIYSPVQEGLNLSI